MEQHRGDEFTLFSSTIDIMIFVCIFVVGFLINRKYLKDLDYDYKHRDMGCPGNVAKDIMTTSTKILLVSMPIHLLFRLSRLVEMYLPPQMQHLLCYKIVLAAWFRNCFGFTSFVIAALRYTFIVHHNKVLKWGKEKIKTIFYYGSIRMPLLIVTLTTCTLKTFPVDHMKNPSICNDLGTEKNNWADHAFPWKGQYQEVMTNSMYRFLNELIPSKLLDYICRLLIILIVIIFSNVVEGVLYWKTFSHMKR